MAKIYKVGSAWYGDYWHHGRRIRKSLSPHKQEAQRILDDILALKKASRLGTPIKDITWPMFKMKYFAFCEANKKAQTIYRDKLAFRMLDECYAMKALSQMTPEVLEEVRLRWQKKKKTPSVVARAVKSIKTAMRYAEDMKYSGPQNWRVVKVEESKGRLIYYSMAQLSALLKRCHGLWKTGAMLMGRAGLRSGEAYHLQMKDIRFDLHALHIAPKACACYECAANKNLWSPKGRKERYVPLVKDLEAHLASLPKRQVWVLGDDRPTLGSWQAYMKRLIKKAKLQGSPHTLRHTFASDLVSNGESLEIVGGILGHSNPKTTQIYAHLRPDALQNAIKRMSKL